jgi:hypothetical protein
LVVLLAFIAAKLALEDEDKTSGPVIVVTPFNVVEAEVILPKIGLSESVYVTVPFASVLTIRLLFVEEAINVYKLAALVVAITPFIFVVITPELALILLLFIIELLEVIPLTFVVKVFKAEARVLVFIKLAVVVATIPLTFEVNTKELVPVEILKLFKVPEFIIDCRSVLVATPLMVVVRTVPLADIPLLFIILLVDTSPFIFVVKVFPEDDCVNKLIKLVTALDIPFTILVNVFVVVEIVLVVLDAIDASDDVEKLTGPLKVVVPFIMVPLALLIICPNVPDAAFNTKVFVVDAVMF